MLAGEVVAARGLHAHVDGSLPLPRELQRRGQLEGEQLVGGGHQEIILATEPVECELQVAERSEPLLLGAGAVAEQTGGEAGRLRFQVALQG